MEASIMFTKQHYVATATALRQLKHVFTYNVEDGGYFLWAKTVEKFSDLFEKDNPKFDTALFLASCLGGRNEL